MSQTKSIQLKTKYKNKLAKNQIAVWDAISFSKKFMKQFYPMLKKKWEEEKGSDSPTINNLRKKPPS